ncbi:MAG: N-acetylmuramoyl-L-alanine amidase [Gammaproteobacteria bacterium]|nr:N-acetylmuramoyl-L-alanine amidase [Gammaproteobacteria bacterium]MBQ0839396.1 N-acetylmuramoyl-L-alanine amidase [Gammaproteobacteria bacterium]
MLSLTERGSYTACKTVGRVGLCRAVFLLLLCLSALWLAQPVLAAAPAATTTNVEGIRLWRAPDHTRLVLDLSAMVEHKVFPLENPERLVIDLKHAALATSSSGLKLANTPIAELRSAKFDQDSLRIVLELKKKINPRSFILARNEQYGDRLVIDLYDRDKQTAKTVSDVLAGQKMRDIVIAIDAGHGGEDPGALGPKRLREKNVVLAISRAMQGMIDREVGFRAVMVRDGDYYIPLRKRTDIARKHRADLMISIHADAFNQASANGASVYALSTRSATSETASYLAKRENRADLIGGVGGVSLVDKDKVLAGVLLDLSMTATLESSLDVGSQVLKSVGGVARLHKKRVEQAGFVVLKSPDIPSILIETGFISNPKEARRLSQPAYQQKMAKAIFSGVKRHFQQRPPVGTLLAANKRKSGVVHVIARGDTLSDIAHRYRVSISDLRRHNRLKSTRIKIGQRIKIPVST